MSTVGEKIKVRREMLGLSQRALAQEAGVNSRMIVRYEMDQAKPSGKSLQKLAEALKVTIAYLITPDADDVNFGKEEAPYVEAARAAYGTKGAMDMQELLQANQAMLAGGDVPQEDKDAFFQAVMEAYMENRRKASEKFNPHKYGN